MRRFQHTEWAAQTAAGGIGGVILADVKRRIVGGEFAPDGRLPTRAALVQAYKTTPVTMQRVFDRLAADGFIRANGREGSFVKSDSPHLVSYGLIFPGRDRPGNPWPLFWRRLRDEAERVAAARGLKLVVSYGNETHRDVRAYRALTEAVRSHKFAGLLFASPPFYLEGSPLLDVPGIPRVALAPTDYPQVHTVELRGDMFGTLAGMLAKTGKRRLALLVTPELEENARVFAAGAGKERGGAKMCFEIRPHWIALAPYRFPGVIKSSATLLMRLPPEDRPDAILVGDDNLCDTVAAAVREAGLRVPEDVAIASHTNFPLAKKDAAPILRAGWDVRAALSACLDALEKQRNGLTLPRVTEVGIIIDETGLSSIHQQTTQRKRCTSQRSQT